MGFDERGSPPVGVEAPSRRTQEWVVSETERDAWVGSEVSWGSDRSGVVIGRDNKGQLLIIRYSEERGPEAKSANESDLRVKGGAQSSLEEWLAQSSVGSLVDRSSIPADAWHRKMGIAEATQILLKAKCQRDRLMPDPPIRRYEGERVIVDDKEYYVVVADQKHGEVLLGRVKSENGAPEVVKKGMSEVYGADHPVGVGMMSQQEAEQNVFGSSMRVSDSPERYTRAINVQRARNESEMGREFYEAGRRIDGSVIQHHPDTEIMVVDFEKDAVMRNLYDDIIARYDRSDPRTRGELPAFIQREIEERFTYNREIVESLADGSLIDKVNDPDFARRVGADRNPNINLDQIRAAARLGAMKDHKLYMGWYVNMGIMICRQMGAVEAAMIERAIDQGRAPGYKGVEIRANMDLGAGDGHLWAVALHERRGEEIYDPAMRYHGEEERGHWNYRKGYENHRFGVPGT